MIRRLKLTNFKPFAETSDIPLAPITLVFGPNSGGKSSLIQSLLLLKQTLSQDGSEVLIPRGKHIDLGSFQSLVHRHEVNRQLQFRVEFSPLRRRDRVVLRAPSHYTRVAELTYQDREQKKNQTTELSKIRYALLEGDRVSLDARFVRFNPDAHLGDDLPLDDRDYEDLEFQVADEESRKSISAHLEERELESRRIRTPRRNRGGAVPEQLEMFESEPEDKLDFHDIMKNSRIGSRYGLPGRIRFPQVRDNRNQLNQMRYDVLTPITTEFVELFHSLSYLGPLRSHPARHYLTMSNLHESVGMEGEYMPEILFQQAETRQKINEWFEQFEIPYGLRIDSIGNEVTGTMISIVLTDKRLNLAVAPSDVGFGIGQLLPILVEGCISKDRVLCVEQPEIHLHPRLQAHLADFFIESAGVKGISRQGLFSDAPTFEPLDPKNQWIIETHSETLMLRLQRRIREGKIPSNAVSVLYVQPGGSGSRVLQLRLDDRGEFIDEWPDGFFDEGFDEVFSGGR
jgi:hypothetical protein